MGKIIRCAECGERYKTVEAIEELRDNDAICLNCDAEVEVEDWDRVLASYEDDDLDDVDDDEDAEDDEDEDEGFDDDWRGSSGDDEDDDDFELGPEDDEDDDDYDDEDED